MNTKKTTENQAITLEKSFVDTLHANGMRATPERICVLHFLASRQGKYYTANDIFLMLNEAGTPIKINTLYNTLQLLANLGLVVKKSETPVGKTSPIAAFSFKNYKESPSAKMQIELSIKCRACGKVKITRDNQLTNYLRRHHFGGFVTLGGAATINIDCLCSKCMQSKNNLLKTK